MFWGLTLYCIPDLSQTFAHKPSNASISFIKCPFPIPPNDGLHDISPKIHTQQKINNEDIGIQRKKKMLDRDI